jgi:TATA-binding protein-associated factor
MSNIFLEWLYDCLKEGQLLCFEVLENTLNSDITIISPICCVFLLRIIKSITVHALREVSMKCLPNLLMGAFISNKTLEFSGRLLKKA